MQKRHGTLWAYVFLSLLGLGVFSLGLSGFTIWRYSMLPAGSGTQSKIVEIPQGTSSLEIARLLRERGVLENDRLFYLLCRIHRASARLQAGEYEFSALSTPRSIMDQLASGRVYVRRITFPEGLTLNEVARVFEEQGLASKDEFLRLSADPEVIKSLGVEADSLEGYLFPETYFFTRDMTELSLLRAMVRQFRSQLPSQWESRAEALGFSLHELVILASLVEKEAAVEAERPRVAAVFHNRLKLGMPLQSDPTAVYDLEGFSGPVRAEHLRRPSPYNTYLIRGLPAGPICNPGRRSIEAALNPEDVNYLYFVSNNDGTHYFSRTLEEHSRAVARYRVLRSQEKDAASP